LLTPAPADPADYTIFGYSWLSDLLQIELKMQLWEDEGARAPAQLETPLDHTAMQTIGHSSIDITAVV